MYKKTLIANYRSRFEDGPKNNTLYESIMMDKHLKNDNIIIAGNSKDEDNDNNDERIRLNFFGNTTKMCGSVYCSNIEALRKKMHAYLKINHFISNGLYGSLVIQRKKLDIQHFCLDFDLNKKKDEYEFQVHSVLNVEEYTQYKKCRERTIEYSFFYNRQSFFTVQPPIMINVNYLIYEIIIILTDLLQLGDFKIFILGKGGNLTRGFHIEIPYLQMRYHDLACIYEYLHSIIKVGDIFFDATMNWSAFGSRKYGMKIDNNNFIDDEINTTYLPYACFTNENIVVESPFFENLGQVFDTFNIFKPIEQNTEIYSLNLFLKEISPQFGNPRFVTRIEDRNRITNALIEHEFLLQSYEVDTSIPEWHTKKNIKEGEEFKNTIRNENGTMIKIYGKKRAWKGVYKIIEDIYRKNIETTNNSKHICESIHFDIIVGHLYNNKENVRYEIFKSNFPKLGKIMYKDITSLNVASLPKFSKCLCQPLVSNQVPSNGVISWNLAIFKLQHYNMSPDKYYTSFTNFIINDIKMNDFIFNENISMYTDNIFYSNNNEIYTERNDESTSSFFAIDGECSLFPYTVNHIVFLLWNNVNIRHTIHYLMAAYLISTKSENNSKKHAERVCNWLLYILGGCSQNNADGFRLVKEFLQIYNHLNYNCVKAPNLISLNKSHKCWIILCIKNLLISENVIGIDEAISIINQYNNNNDKGNDNQTIENCDNDDDEYDEMIDCEVINYFGKSQTFNIKGATHTFNIPYIIVAAILLAKNDNVLYELLAIYQPIILKRNGHGNNSKGRGTMKKIFDNSKKCNANLNDNGKLVIWTGYKWRKCPTSSISSSNIHMYLPEIYYIGNIRSHVLSYKKQRQSDRLKKMQADIKSATKKKNKNSIKVDDNREVEGNVVSTATPTFSVSPKKNLSFSLLADNLDINLRKHFLISNHIHCKTNKNSGSIINDMIYKMYSFWNETHIFNPPPIFLKMFSDHYILAGLCINRNYTLINIKPLPMYYYSDQDNECPTNLDNIDVSEWGKEKMHNENNGEEQQQQEEDMLDIDVLLSHMGECKFLHQQIFPIFHRFMENISLDYRRNNYEKLKKLQEERNCLDGQKQKDCDSIDDQLEMSMNRGHISGAGGNILCSSETIIANKRKFANLTKREFHIHLTTQLCENKETLELVKLTKYFILKQIANSYVDMVDIMKMIPENKSLNIMKMIDTYTKNTPKEREASLPDRIRILAENYEIISKTHIEGANFLPDIPVDEMTPVLCNCPVTYILISLLQTFSYDVASLIYFFKLILKAICCGPELKSKNLHIFLGETNSGKTTFLNHILSVFGNHAGILSSHTITHSSTIDRYHDISKSHGFAKFWYMDEIANKPFNRQLVNQLTGNSRLFIRSNFEAGKNVKLASTILIFGNNKPQFTEQCSALISRLKYMSFRSRFDSTLPVNFKMSHFPKLSTYNKHENTYKIGIGALFLHAICHSTMKSPLYLYDKLFVEELDTTQNIRDSTDMYSPITDIVNSIIHLCNLEEDATHMITQKRIIYLIINLNILKQLNVSSISDAIHFLSKRYFTTLIDDAALKYENDEFKDGLDIGKTTVFHGLKEKNVVLNDERILSSKKRKIQIDCTSNENYITEKKILKYYSQY